jgi:VWFA-related protein
VFRHATFVVASLAVSWPVGVVQTPPRTRSVYVTAVDASGRVVDLTAADLVVREDGRTRPVTQVSRATSRLSIALLVEDSGVGMNDFRAGIAGFINRLGDQAAFSIVGIAEQNRTIVDYTSESAALAGAIRLLLPRNVNGGGHLVEAVLEAATTMVRQERERPVIVILTNQGREDSEISAARAMVPVMRVGARIYVVEVLRRSGQSRPEADRYDTMAGVDREKDQARNIILGDGPRQTGGRRAELSSTTDVPKALSAMAEELAGQLVVTYQTDIGAGTSSRLEISTARRGVKVHAPARVGDRLVR